MELVAQPKLVVQTTRVKSYESGGVHFSALSGASSRNFIANRILVNSNTWGMIPSEIPSEVDIFIRLPSALSQPNTNIDVGFALYDNDVFFQSKSFKSSSGTRRRVISGSMQGLPAEYVEIHIKKENASGKVLHDFACVFWDYNISDWSDMGCYKSSSDPSSLECYCYHTTNFAVLMSFKKEAKALNWISIVGCVLCILGLSVTLVYQIMTRESRRNTPTALLVCLCTSMIIYNLAFVTGISNPHAISTSEIVNNVENNATSLIVHDPDKGLCTLVTVLLQFFLLATFSFNTLYAADLLMLLRGRSGHFTIIYMIVGWGFPAVMVAISLAVSYRVDNPLNYRRHEACWLAATDDEGNFDFKKPMLWGFLVPVSAMLLFNAYVLMYFAYLSFRQPFLNSSKNAALKKKLLSNFFLGVVLGLSWFLGYLVLASSSSDGLYILLNVAFSVLVSMQGVQVFILFKARSTLFRRTTANAVKFISDISKGKNSRTTHILCESPM